MTVRDQDHNYHEVEDIFDVYIFGVETWNIYLDVSEPKPLNYTLGKYKTLEKAKCVLADLLLAFRDNVKLKRNRKFYFPQDD